MSRCVQEYCKETKAINEVLRLGVLTGLPFPIRDEIYIFMASPHIIRSRRWPLPPDRVFKREFRRLRFAAQKGMIMYNTFMRLDKMCKGAVVLLDEYQRERSLLTFV